MILQFNLTFLDGVRYRLTFICIWLNFSNNYKILISALNCLGTSVENQLAIYV